MAYYESAIFDYPLGRQFREEYGDLPWIPIENHNFTREMQGKPNDQLGYMKRNLIVGIRKTHKYVENHKVSGYLVLYTLSGCTAMCLYCYLVCNYNKYAYLKLFVNREQMLDRTIKKGKSSGTPLTFEIENNNDLVLENTTTGNLLCTILCFVEEGKGKLTFLTKFHMVKSLSDLDHRGKVIFRMGVNSQPIIQKIELGTSGLRQRIEAVNQMCEARCPCGSLIAPVILVEGWKEMYTGLLEGLRDGLLDKMKNQMLLEIILMTHPYVRRAINSEVFPNVPDPYDREQMVGKGRGRYCYRAESREETQLYLRQEIGRVLGSVPILYISRHGLAVV